MQQSPLLRDWDWIQEGVIPLLFGGRPPAAKPGAVGSVAGVIAVPVAFPHSARSAGPSRRRGLHAYASGCHASGAPITFGTADLGSVPTATRDACFRRQERRWVPESAIAERVLLGEPTGPVDLVTLRQVEDLDGAPVDSRLRRGGHLRPTEQPAVAPVNMRPAVRKCRFIQQPPASHSVTLL